MAEAATCARNDNPVAYGEVGALEGTVDGEALARSVRGTWYRQRTRGEDRGGAYRAEDGGGVLAREAVRDGNQVVDISNLGIW